MKDFAEYDIEIGLWGYISPLCYVRTFKVSDHLDDFETRSYKHDVKRMRARKWIIKQAWDLGWYHDSSYAPIYNEDGN